MPDPGSAGPPQPFPSTLWSAVLGAADRASPECRERLDALVRTYWRPVYWTLRSRWNRSHDDALDMTQSFFTMLLEKDALASVGPEKGRFRAWLRVVLDNFMRNEHAAAAALKRGGGAKTISLDAQEEAPPIASGDLPAEGVFDRAWAIHIFYAAVEDLRGRFRSEGRDAAFRWFERHELDRDPPSCEALAAEAGVRVYEVENALKAARAAFAKALRSRVQETIADPGRVEEELRVLREALG